MSAASTRTDGYALIEALIALLLFSLAMVGALQAQRVAIQSTWQTLTELRAQQLLQDLVGPMESATSAAALADLSSAVPTELSGPLRRWLDRTESTREIFGRARVCFERADGLVTVSFLRGDTSGPFEEVCASAQGSMPWHIPLR